MQPPAQGGPAAAMTPQRKKPSSYYSCDPTKELIRYTALLAAWCAALLMVLFAISAAGELLRHLTRQPEIHAARPK